MKSILEKFDLINEQAGAGSGEELTCSGDTLQCISPIDSQRLGKIRCASTEDYEKIITRATAAFTTWRMVPAPKRGEIVRQIGEVLRDHKKSLAEVISLEVGKIRAEAEGEVQALDVVAVCLRDLPVQRLQVLDVVVPVEDAVPDDRLARSGTSPTESTWRASR